MRITLIGSGNVATHLAAAFKNAGHKIVQVYSPNYQNAAMLAYHVGAEAVHSMDEITDETDLFVISVKDDVIESVVKQLASYQKLIVHTSGATDMDAITKYHIPAGVFYPLQTFSKVKEVDFRQVPLCIEGSTHEVTSELKLLAHTISNHVSLVNSQQRKILHLAAVFACNFPNYLYSIAKSLLTEHHLDFGLLKPLILETAMKVQERDPATVQTGPAVRNDEKTMDEHLQLLADKPDLQQLYGVLSQSIIKMAFTPDADK